MTVWLCTNCAVEHAEPVTVCAICEDERQWVPAEGQHWTTLAELATAGSSVDVDELEPGLYGLTARMPAGIGQQSKLLCTSAGNLLWDPVGYLDDNAVARVQAVGGAQYIVASHPHMFGAQVEWSRALDNAAVLVSETDRDWVTRPDAVIETWSGTVELLPGVTLTQPGGHFPGSAIAHWTQGADGRGVLLSGDTVLVNPDRATVSFMRSFANRIPLSAAVVRRIESRISEYDFDRIYDNFHGVIASGARVALAESAARHIAWVNGEFDHLT